RAAKSILPPESSDCYTFHRRDAAFGGSRVAEGESRTFLRGLSSETYGLGEFRRRQRAADRVRRAGTVVDDASVGHSGDSDQSRTSWMLGRSAAFDAKGFGTREDWSKLWTPGATQKKKVVKKSDTRWENTREGRVRVISSPDKTDVRTNSVDVYQQEIAPGGKSAKHWHMADEAVYVMAGKGHSLHWDVEAEIAEKYYARIAEEPSRWNFGAGDLVYIPQNTVHQHVNDGDEPLLFLSAQNRLVKPLGYDNVVY